MLEMDARPCLAVGMVGFDGPSARRAAKAGILVCANHLVEKLIDGIGEINVDQTLRFCWHDGDEHSRGRAYTGSENCANAQRPGGNRALS